LKTGTLLVHSPGAVDPVTGALSTPVYQASTFDQSVSFQESAGERGAGIREFDYTRSGNPTRKALEETIAALEAGESGYAFASGMAATSSVLGIFQAGDHIITAEDVYGGSYRIINTFYKRWGLEATAVDSGDPENIRKALRPNTKALFLETPSNPLLKITDLKAAFAIAKEAGIVSIVDNTFMTPLLQRPLELGADIVIHSATKFLGGHSDLLAGLAAVKNRELGRRIYQVQNGFGAVLGPWDSWLLLRGIKTLRARMAIQQETAAFLAGKLAAHPNVEAVYYPGLAGHPGKAIHDAQASGPGAVFSFKTKTPEQALRFLGRTKLAAAAVSLGGVETIASYPVRMSHAAMPPEERQRLGITDNLIRISAGLEDAEDLAADFMTSLSN
jgi:cystathionine beta-lyase